MVTNRGGHFVFRARRTAGLPAGLIFILLVSSLIAQVATTSLRGVVADPAGARIKGAQVTLANPANGFTRTTTTNDRGEYQFLEVPVGSFTLAAAATGFTSTRKPDVVLLVNTPANVDFTLPVGKTQTVVEVHGEAPAVNAADATLGNAFDSRQITSLPSEGRNAVELLSLQAGVAYVGNQVNTDADSRGGAVNGARSDQTDITVDGLDNNDPLLGYAFTGALRIPMDSLEEFRVTTTNANADSGRSSGAQVSLVTKSGTNQFHGSAYEYNRTLVGAANDWFNKEAQLTAGLPNQPGELIRNTFGAAVGGPIMKNRLFFFANYEGQRSREAVQTTQSVPSANLRQGIVSYLAQNGSVVTLEPATIKSLDQGCLSTGTCPNGNGVSQAVLNLWDGKDTLPDGTPIPAYPLPNTNSAAGSDGLNILGYTFAAPQPTDLNTYLAKLDYNLTANGNHRLFVRGNLQNDRTLDAAQFPGEPPGQVLHNNSKGIAVGETAVLRPTLINNFRYGYVRQGLGDAGPNPFSNISFQNLSDQVSFARTVNVNVPVNQLVDDVTWTKGQHTIQFGGNWRLVDDNRFSNAQNFFNGATHPDWLYEGGISFTGQDLDPANDPALPAMNPAFGYSYDAAISNVTGILGSIEAIYNQNKNGQYLPVGALVPRHFRSNEAEFYTQDAWRVKSNLQLTLGLRYTLLETPYETAGNQVSPAPGLGTFFNQRTAAMDLGQAYRPTIRFALSGQANGQAPYWSPDYKDIAPRLAFAYSPNSSGRFWESLLGGSGKTSIRGGYGLYYDHFGEGVVNSFDREGAYGLTTYLLNPSGLLTTNCAERFINLTTMPTGAPGGSCNPVAELPPQPASGFPATPPAYGANGSFALAWGIDNTMRTPYSHVVDFSITREFPRRFVVELSYVGRFGRRLLQEVDLAEPVDMKDPKSGMTYFQAAAALARMAMANTPESSVKKIPFWEDFFPGAAGPAGETGAAPGIPANPTATQNIYDSYYANNPNFIYALEYLDATFPGVPCFPACSTLGPYAFWDPQFSSLFSWRTTGTSNYNAFQAGLRRHVGGMEFDFNYTFSKSLDENSNAERVNEYENGTGAGSASAVAYSGQVINSWDTHGLYGPSDYDATHQINANWVYDLPLGHGKPYGAQWNKGEDALFGGWEISGLARWTSGYPFSISTYAFATNYEQDGRAVVLGAAPQTGVSVEDGVPNVFKEGPAAVSAFRFALPGESGERNNLRGPGYFGLDASLAKSWKLMESQALRFSWDVFNATNAVRFDDGTLNQYLLYGTTLGNFTQTLTHPRVMQFGLRYSF
ncbi:MAG TPA: carboxypeptidase-like regulatory domain-containing protein [Terriglobales bacterium]|nr:carboxypeptidase-like regulatory domain-containing protein [Terriglobales bacterium]